MASTGSNGSAQVTDMIITWVLLVYNLFPSFILWLLLFSLSSGGVNICPCCTYTRRHSRVYFLFCHEEHYEHYIDVHIQPCITE